MHWGEGAGTGTRHTSLLFCVAIYSCWLLCFLATYVGCCRLCRWAGMRLPFQFAAW